MIVYQLNNLVDKNPTDLTAKSSKSKVFLLNRLKAKKQDNSFI